MICSRGGYSESGVQWWVFFCPFASSSGQSTLASVSPLNWPIPTSLHEKRTATSPTGCSPTPKSPTASPHVYRKREATSQFTSFQESEVTQKAREPEEGLLFWWCVSQHGAATGEKLIFPSFPPQIAPSDPEPPSIQSLSRIVRLAITCWTCFEFARQACYREAAKKPLQSWMSTVSLCVHVPRRQIRSGICSL